MLRRHFQLPAHMICTQLPEKRIVRIRHHIVKPDPRTDEYLLYLRDLAQLPEQPDIVLMIRF